MDRFPYFTKKRRIPRSIADNDDGLYAFDFSTYTLKASKAASYTLSPYELNHSLQKHLQSPTFAPDAVDLSYFPQEGNYPATVALDIAGTTGDINPKPHTTTLILAKHTLSRRVNQLVIHQAYSDDEYEALLSEREQFNMPLSTATTPQTTIHDPYAVIRQSQNTVQITKEPMTYRHHKLLATALGALASSPHALQ